MPDDRSQGQTKVRQEKSDLHSDPLKDRKDLRENKHDAQNVGRQPQKRPHLYHAQRAAVQGQTVHEQGD